MGELSPAVNSGAEAPMNCTLGVWADAVAQKGAQNVASMAAAAQSEEKANPRVAANHAPPARSFRILPRRATGLAKPTELVWPLAASPLPGGGWFVAKGFQS